MDRRNAVLSRVLGALGAVLLLSSSVTLFFGDTRFLLAKVLLGAVALAAAFALGEPGGLRRFFAGRALHFGLTTAVSGLALVVLLGVLNWTAHRRPHTWDLTRDRIFTLQEDTLRTLSALDRDVKAVAVYRAGEEGWDAAEALLRRYADRSPRFTYELVDPYRHPERAAVLGVTAGGPRVFLVAGKEKAPATGLDEAGITNALVRVTRQGTRHVYVMQGHGEPPLEGDSEHAYGAATRALRGEGFEVTPLQLTGSGDAPADAAAVLVPGPRSALLPRELDALTRYAAAGGHLGLFVEPEVDAGLDPLLRRWGVQADDDVVVDPSPAAQLLGSPVTPLAVPSGAHAISRPLADTALVFPTARSLVALRDGGALPTPLALTTREAWGETDVKGVFEKGEARRDEGEKGGPLPLAMAVERPAGGEGRKGRAVVVGDADFFTNAYLGLGANRDFFLNAVSWLAEQEDRITIRPRRREGSVVLLTQAQATLLDFLAVDVLPVALIAIGLAIWTVRRAR